jgi:hypothetical protein
MGTATAALTANTVYLGVDWRHFARGGNFTGGERVVRGIFDFFETNGGGLVPVQLVEFDAKARGNDVDVFWATASETNTDHYVIDRATGTADFSTIRTVPAAGNSTVRRDYAITDEQLAPGTYSYRLTGVDKDGARSAAQIVNVTIEDGAKAISLANVYPNPVATSADVSFTLTTAGDVQLVLVNTAGQEVATIENGFFGIGTHTARINAANLASGAYTLVLRSNGLTAVTNVTIAK